MRIIAPYTKFTDETFEGLIKIEQAGFRVEYFEMVEDSTYEELLALLWSQGETFLNIEHDIFGVTPEIVSEFETCPEEWCSSPYDYFNKTARGRPVGGLGCTKFGAQLMARWPGAMDLANRLPCVGHPDGHWCTRDLAIYRVLRHGGVFASEWPAERHQTHTEVRHRQGVASHVGCCNRI
jgi:hypothetical protein